MHRMLTAAVNPRILIAIIWKWTLRKFAGSTRRSTPETAYFSPGDEIIKFRSLHSQNNHDHNWNTTSCGSCRLWLTRESEQQFPRAPYAQKNIDCHWLLCSESRHPNFMRKSHQPSNDLRLRLQVSDMTRFLLHGTLEVGTSWSHSDKSALRTDWLMALMDVAPGSRNLLDT